MGCLRRSRRRQDARCNGYLYDEAWDAERSQIPLNYYIWYYTVNHKEFRVGIYPTNLEDGIPGGLY